MVEHLDIDAAAWMVSESDRCKKVDTHDFTGDARIPQPRALLQYVWAVS